MKRTAYYTPLVLMTSLFLSLFNELTLAEEKSGSEIKEGTFSGAKDTEYPDWFKDSFLHLDEDIQEATEANKRLVLFFYQDGCPYCNALVERNFSQKDIKEKAQKNFDIITINMWGDRLVKYVDGKEYTEKNLATTLKVQFTPTVLFFNEQGKIILRLNGYRSPQRFNVDLDYVANHQEDKSSYRDYVKAKMPAQKANKELNHQEFFLNSPFDVSSNARKGNPRPIAIFFEQKDCPDCDRLHQEVIPAREIQEIIKHFDVYQLDMWSKTPVITTNGKKTTARMWAKDLDIKYAPSIVLFNPQGEEIIRSEAYFKVFHTQGIFNYVLSEGYRKEPSFQRYLSDYAESIRGLGNDVNIWRNASE